MNLILPLFYRHILPFIVILLQLASFSYEKESEEVQIKTKNNPSFMLQMMKEMDQLRHEMQQLKTNLITGNSRDNSERATTVNIGLPRSCSEIKEFNPSFTSGEYIIDPDGMHVGSDPITVLCDSTTGATLVSHDSETKSDSGNCLSPGCYTRPIIYTVPFKQLEALAEISDTCSQYFEYECRISPFEYNGVQYIYWEDRTGKPSYYWAGSNTTRHTCQCGLDGACVNADIRCNCDSSSNTNQLDKGLITEKDALPIQRLKFGKVSSPAQASGNFTLGKFECSGRAVVNGMPTSCREVYRIGHIFNDFYSIKRNGKIETVFCDFSFSPLDPKYETRLGYEDLKSSQIYFDVARSTEYSLTGSSIPWENEKLNVGKALNLINGQFTAPVPGRYFFAFVGKNSQANSVVTTVYLTIDGMLQAEVYDTASSASSNAPLQATLELRKGQTVFMYLASGIIDAKSRFTGWLIEQDLDI